MDYWVEKLRHQLNACHRCQLLFSDDLDDANESDEPRRTDSIQREVNRTHQLTDQLIEVYLDPKNNIYDDVQAKNMTRSERARWNIIYMSLCDRQTSHKEASQYASNVIISNRK